MPELNVLINAIRREMENEAKAREAVANNVVGAMADMIGKLVRSMVRR